MSVRDVVQAAAGALGGEKLYIEDTFSTYLYTGNGSTQTITNGVDLDAEGGMVWCKSRSNATDNYVFDTERGVYYRLITNTTASSTYSSPNLLTAYNSNGFSLGDGETNVLNYTYASWTFRKTEKFFDVVTWTGNGSNRTIAHNLGSVPGCIFVKRTDFGSAWQVYHRSLANTEYLVLNTTDAKATGTTRWNSTTATSTEFSIGTDSTVNASGGTYVAYIFAHDAGGFGDSGEENVISCGSFAGVNSPSNVTVNLGWEPQWVLVKVASGDTNSWLVFDNMRGVPTGITDAFLKPNSSDAEGTSTTLNYIDFNATGFTVTGDFQGMASGRTFIYIAIRRGPMKTPESGTEVFNLDASSAGSSGGLMGAISASDLVINSQRNPAYNSPFVFIDRLRGVGQVNTGNTTKALYSSSTAAETTVDTTSTSSTADGVNGAYLYSAAGKNSAIRTVQQGSGGSVAYNLCRAPGFFDVVCYTGTGVSTGRTVSHNLSVAPELMIIKWRDGVQHWYAYSAPVGNERTLFLSSNSGVSSTSIGYWYNTTPTSTVFTLGAGPNGSERNYIAYLFATLAGVSKVGSYTGTGTTLQVNCGFSAGARFVLIKRTDDVGDWYVWDSARGIVSGNDPYLLLNSTAAEVTSTDYIDPYSAGFEISSSAPAAINASGGSFIYLAIA